MRRLQHLFVGGQRQLGTHQVLRLLFVRAEGVEQKFDVGMLEVVGRLLDFVLVINVAVGQAFRPGQVEDVFDALQVHGQAFDAVGDFAGDRLAVDAADLLEVGELRHFHAVHPDFPAEAPGTERRVFPVVLDEAHVVLLEVQAERFERAEIEFENVVRRRFQDHLVLVVMLHAVRVFAVATILRAARRLDVGGLPWFGADGAQESGGVAGAGADFHIVGLQQRAAFIAPVLLQTQDDFLKSRFVAGGHRTHSV